MKRSLKNFKPGLRMSEKLRFKAMAPIPHWTPTPYIDGKPYILPADDQGDSSRCTSYAITGICEGLAWWATGVKSVLPTEALYERQQEIDGHTGDGSTLDTAIRAAKEFGWLSFTTPEGMTATINPFDIQTVDQMKQAMHRCPAVLLGLNITDKWGNVGRDGLLPDGGEIIGGHAIILDYFNAIGVDICNSWSRDWGNRGHAFLKWNQIEREFLDAKGFILTVK